MTIIGHDHILQRLETWLKRDTLPHALLLTGPPSVGKRRVADWLAEYIVGESDTLSLAFQKDEITIDAIRSLRRLASLSSSSAPHVVILDGIDYLRAEAANAFLKTLEEPPTRIIFLLIAHGSECAVLPTIVSRSTLLRFSPVPTRTIADALCNHYDVKEETAQHIARHALGAPGRAIACLKSDIVDDAIERCFSFASALQLPLSKRFALVKKIVDNKEERLFVHAGLLFLRDVMVFQEGCDDMVVVRDTMTSIEETARQLTPDRIRALLATLLAIEEDITHTNVNTRLALEQPFVMV